jgi:hypothetical protein
MSILIAPSDLPFHNRKVISGPWTLICENDIPVFFLLELLQVCTICTLSVADMHNSNADPVPVASEGMVSHWKLLDNNTGITGTNRVHCIVMK